MPVTIKDVAKEAKVSPSTVSRVIADNPKISKETKEKVYMAMKKLNYHPNAIARSLANKSTKTLGLILPNTAENLFTNPFFIQAMRGISVYSQKKGYYIMYNYSDNEEEEVEFIRKYINSKWVDGIILLTVREDDECVKYLKSIKHPFVVIGKPEDREDVLWVDNDNIKAMYDVVDLLVNKGNKSIAFIGGPQSLNVTKNRLEGYKRALRDNGLGIDEDLILEGDFSEDKGFKLMNNLLDYNVPDAVVTTDDIIAFGALRAINERTIKNIAVVGFNNTILAKYQTPKLASVDVNAEELGYRAAQLLINKLENKKLSINNHIVDTKIIERESINKKPSL